VAVFNLLSPAIDGPNVALVIRFEREGEERFARDPCPTANTSSSRTIPGLKSLRRHHRAAPVVVECWCGLVERMNRRALDRFTRDIWKRFDRRDLEPLKWAIIAGAACSQCNCARKRASSHASISG